MKAVTAYLRNVTTLIGSYHGDEGAVVNATRSLTSMRDSDPDFDDEEFQKAGEELAQAAMPKVSIVKEK